MLIHPLSLAMRSLGIAASRMGRIRIGAEWSQLCLRIRHTDHREWPGVVLPVERSELGRIVRGETAPSSVLWIVEPETQVEGVGRWKCGIRIETEDLVQQDRLDPDMTVVAMLPDLDVRLIPRKTEAAFKDSLEVRIGRLI